MTPGDLGLPHKGEIADWDVVAKTGVQHFKMVLPEDGTEYQWNTDPELKEVRKLNMFEYAEQFVVVRDHLDCQAPLRLCFVRVHRAIGLPLAYS